MVSLIGGSNVNVMEVRVSGDTTDLQSSLDEAAMAIRGFKAQIASLGAVASIAAVGGIAASVAAAERWNQVQRELAKITSVEQAQKLGDAMRDLSRDIPVATKQLGQLATQAARFGIEGTKNIKSFTETVAKMASATDMSTDEAGQSMAKLAELTNTPIKEVENLGSSIAKLENNMATSASEIVDAGMRAGGTLTRMGASQEQVMGLVAALNEVNYSARRSGTGLRRVGQEMLDPSNTKALAKSLGMTASQFKRVRDESPTKTLLRLASTLKENNKQSEVLMGTLSTYATKTLSQLGQNLEGARNALNMSSEAYEKGTKLQEEYEIQTDSLTAALKRLRNSIMDTAISIGNVFVPHLKRAIEAILPALDAFDQWVEKSGAVTSATIMVATAIGGLIPALGLMVQVTPALTTILTAGSAAFLSLASSAAAVIAPLAAVAYIIHNNVAGIRDAIENIASVVGSEFRMTMIAFETLTSAVLSTLEDEWGVHADTVTSRLETIVDLLEGSIIDGIRWFGSAVRQAIYGLLAFWQLWGEEIVSITSSFIGDLFDVIGAGLGAIIDAWRGNWELAAESLEVMVSQALEIVNNVWDELVLLFDTGMESLESIVTDSDLSPFWEETLLDILDITESLMGAVTLAWNGQWGDMATSLSNAGDDIRDIGERTFNAIADIAGSALEDTRTAVIGSDIDGAVESVLSDALSVAESIGLAIEDTLRGNWDDVVSHLETAWSNIKDIAETAWDEVTGIISDKISDVTSTLSSIPWGIIFQLAISTIQGYAEDAFNRVVTIAENVRSDLERAISSWAGAIQTGISNAFSRVQTWVSNALGRAETAIRNHPITSTITTKFDEISSAISNALGGASPSVDFSGIASSIQSAIDNAVSTLSSTSWSGVTSSIQSSLESAFNSLSSASFSGVASSIQTALDNAFSGLSVSNFDSLTSRIQTALDNALSGISSTSWSDITSGISGAVDTITSELAKIQSQAAPKVSSAVSTISSEMSKLRSNLPKPVKDGLNSIETALNTHKNNITSTLSSIQSELQSKYGDEVESIKSDIDSALSKIETWWNNHKSTIKGYLKAIGEGIISHYKDKLITLKDAVKTATDTMSTEWKNHKDDVVGHLKDISSQIDVTKEDVRNMSGPAVSAAGAVGLLTGRFGILGRTIGGINFGKVLGPLGKLAKWALAGFGLSKLSNLKKLKKLKGPLKKIGGYIKKLGGPLKKAGVAAAGFLASFLPIGKASFAVKGALGGVLNRVGLLVARFFGAGASASFASSALGLVSGALTGVGAILGGGLLAALAVGVASLFNFAGAGETMSNALDRIKKGLQGSSKSASDWGTLLGDIVSEVISKFDTLLSIAGGVAKFFMNKLFEPIVKRASKELGQRLPEILDELFKTFSMLVSKGEGAVNSIVQLWNQWGDEIMGVASFVMDALVGIFDAGLDAIITGFLVLNDFLQGDFMEGISRIAPFFERQLGGIVDFVAKWGRKLLEHFGVWEKWGDELTGVSKFVLDTLNGLAKGFGGFIKALGNAYSALKENGIGAAISSLIEGAKSALGGFVSYVKKWGTKLLKHLGVLDDWKQFLKKPISSMIKWGKSALKGFINWLSGIDWGKALNTFADIAGGRKSFGLMSLLDHLGGSIDEFIGRLMEGGGGAIKKVMNGISKTIANAWSDLLGWFMKKGDDIVTFIVQGLKGLATKMKPHIDKAINWLETKWSQAVKAAEKWFGKKLPQWINAGIQMATTFIKTKWGGIKSWLGTKFSQIVGTARKWITNKLPTHIKNGINAAVKWFKTKIPGIKSWLSTKFSQIVSTAQKWISNKLPTHVKNGLNAVKKWVKSKGQQAKKWASTKFKQMVKAGKKWIKNKLPKKVKQGIEMVKKWIKQKGEQAKKFLKQKAKQAFNKAKKWLKTKLPKMVKKGIQKVKKWIKKKMQQGKKQLKKKAKQAFKKAKKWLFTKLPKKIKQGMKKVKKWIQKRMKQAKKQLKQKAKKAFNKAKKWLFTKLPKKIKKGMKKVKKWIKKRMKQAKKQLKQKAKKAFQKAKKWLFTKLPKKIKKGMKKVKKWIKKRMKQAKKQIKQKAKKAFQKAKKWLFTKLPKKVKKGMKKVKKWVKKQMKKVKKQAKQKAKKAFKKIKKFLFKKAPKKVKEGMKKLKKWVKQQMKKAKNEAKNKAKKAFEKIKNFLFKKAPNKVETGMKNLKNYVKNKLNTAKNKAREKSKTAYQKIKNYLFKKAPNKAETGMTNIKNYVKNKLNTAKNKAQSKMKKVKSAVEDALSKAATKAQNWSLPGDVKSKASSAVTKFDNNFDIKGVVDDAISAVDSALSSWTPDWPDLSMPDYNFSPSVDINPDYNINSSGPSGSDGSAGDGRGGNEGPPGRGSMTGFAHGGFVTKPTPAMVGEGPHNEAILPMPKLNRLMDSAAKVGAQAGGGGGSGVNIEHVNIHANSHAGGRAAARGFKEELRSNNFD